MDTAEDSIPLYDTQFFIFVKLEVGKLLSYTFPESRSSERGESIFSFKSIPE
ncbi:hypothetical protein [Borreliella valaisiana]|uniref:hypothetical protein n=1 Tax=Borreliella valaisiana TaxID=62088 RepID=UPI001F25ACCD|nr:hypothetical protein [Borreliella valaisiana]